MKRIIFILWFLTHLIIFSSGQELTCISSDNMSSSIILFSSTGGSFIDAVFTADSTYRIRFARGNLQYQPSTGKWRIARRQCDFVGGKGSGLNSTGNGEYGTVWENGVRCTNNYRADKGASSYTETYLGWIDLFPWGASGWYGDDEGEKRDTVSLWRKNHNANKKVTARPHEVQGKHNFILGGDPTQGLHDDYEKADWGIRNWAQLDSSTIDNPLRTPTQAEALYILRDRPNARQLRGIGSIVLSGNGGAKDTIVNGLIILPDNWEQLKPASVRFVSEAENFEACDYSQKTHENTYTFSEWEIMEAVGAVFLPAAGGMGNDSIGIKYNRMGAYWSADASIKTSGTSYNMQFGPTSRPQEFSESRWFGRSVRLCQKIK